MSDLSAHTQTPEQVADPSLPAVTTVVLNWHGRADTVECLRGLAALSYPRHSLILIDNGCQQFSAAEVASVFPNGRYEHSPVNLGFAGGANFGMRAALAGDAAYVWFLNNDAVPEPHALAELVATMQGDPGIAVVGPKVLQLDRPERLDSIALSLSLRSGRLYLTGHDEVDRGQYDHLTTAPAVSGCAMLVRASAGARLEGFDENYFAYLEDADLCLRVRELGWTVAVAPRARVLHRRAPATGGRQSTASLYYTARNHLLLMRRHAPARGLAVRLACVVALNLAFAVRGSAAERRQRWRAVWRGVHDYQRGRFGAAGGLTES